MALKHVKILDLTRVLAGPYATMLLGDRGAQIIKIERPFSGDDTRTWGPPFLSGSNSNEDKEKVSSYFLSVNRNKKSVAIDMQHKRGADLVRELALTADVLIHNFRQSSLDKLKLDYASLSSENPKLIYCSISGFGDSGAMRSRAGYDVGVAAEFGLMSITGMEDGPPNKVGVAVTDIASGLMAANGVLTALVERNENGGRGCFLSASLMETQLSFLTSVALNALNTDSVPKRYGSAHESLVPYQAFRCSDDEYMFVGCGNDAQFKSLLNSLKLDEGIDEHRRWGTNEMRVSDRQTLIKKLGGIFAEAKREHWLESFKNVSFVAAPVNNVKEAFLSPQVKERESVISVNHPIAGNVLMPAHPLKFKKCHHDNYENVSYTAPPLLGQHTVEVLRDELNIDDKNLRSLVDDKVVQVQVRSKSSFFKNLVVVCPYFFSCVLSHVLLHGLHRRRCRVFSIAGHCHFILFFLCRYYC